MWRKPPARESSIEQWAVRWARNRDIIVAKLTECVGIPDRIFFIPGGDPLIIEFKRPGPVRYGKLQEYYLEKLTNAGYRAVTVTSKNEFLDAIRIEDIVDKGRIKATNTRKLRSK